MTGPRTAAGRDVMRKIDGNTVGPDDEEIYLDDILAIEDQAFSKGRSDTLPDPEAASPDIEALRAALERIAREGWERTRNPGDDAFVMASMAEDALDEVLPAALAPEAQAMNAKGMRQWITLALMGGEITAQDAAARLSRVDKAEIAGEPIPDIRSDFHVQDAGLPTFEARAALTPEAKDE
jgi:hypothetical protein